MGGSQLKQLKATLKAHGLTGQTNVKKKGKKSKAPSETRKDDHLKLIQNIREQFNPFDIKVNKNKREDAGFVKGSVGKPGISKQIGEDQRKQEYESRKKRHNKVGGVVDRRFGEHNNQMTPEEKMLERFTRERQSQSSRSNLYNLEDESDNDMLTHYGKSLSLNDDFDDGDLGLLEDDDAIFTKKRAFDDNEPVEGEAPRKKTKAEVMKEVMAKSKFYKHQRQQLQEQTESKVMDLDDEFGDIMQALQTVPQVKPQFVKKSEQDIQYDTAVKELALDRRAAPADRTKTDEEINKEREEHQKKLEEARLRRMNNMSDDERNPEADDLDEFWEGSEEEEGFAVDGEEVEGSEEAEGSDLEDGETSTAKEPGFGRTLIKKPSGYVRCPESHEQFLQDLENIEFSKQPQYVSKVIEHYNPKLAAGNKEKIGVFAKVLLNHILHLADTDYADNKEFNTVQEKLITQLRELSEKYNEPLVEEFRSKIEEIQKRIVQTQSGEADSYPLTSDLVFYSLVGMIFSTSDHYHLVVTSTIILMGESLEQTKLDSVKAIFSGCFITDMFLQYHRISKRYTPEVTSFLEKSLLALIPEPSKIESQYLTTTNEPRETNLSLSSKDKITITESKLSLRELNSEPNANMKAKLVLKILQLVEKSINIWKEKAAFIEISQSFMALLKHLIKYYANVALVSSILAKLINLNKILSIDHKPLMLQKHKPLAIATFAPKFEENFNPDKKSYDPNRDRQEVSKLKAEIKKERKFTMREIRKDTKFNAREQIKEKKVAYKEYHGKMANIVNVISTTEGAEKNLYEKEKKQRSKK